MRKGFLRSFRSDESGAVAPLYALMLFGLIGIGGVGFDYGRMMAMDSELQNAADAAALAAATQLNGQSDAMNVAFDAAKTAFATAGFDPGAGRFVNETRFSNDGDGRSITGVTFRFYRDYNYDTDTGGTGEGPVDLLCETSVADGCDVDEGEEATVVQITINGREVFYALTPVVGAISSGGITASAMATLQQGTCDVVPLMFCAPTPDFGTDADIGKGMRLHRQARSNEIRSPGNFGFLDIPYENSGSPNQRLGLNTQGGVCVSGRVNSDPGNRAAELPPFNTRFERYRASANNLDCDSLGNYCASQNARQPYVQEQVTQNSATSSVDCDATPRQPNLGREGNDWVNRPEVGFPLDSSIAGGSSFGEGLGSTSDWNAYMAANHGGASTSSVPSASGVPTRYEMYQWERDGNHMDVSKVASTSELRNNGRFNVTNYCAYPRPLDSANVFAPDTELNQQDRRVLTVAAVDCAGLNGSAPVKILRWVDIFLLEPTLTSGNDTLDNEKDLLAEVIGPAKRPDGGSGFQTFGRGKAVLIR